MEDEGKSKNATKGNEMEKGKKEKTTLQNVHVSCFIEDFVGARGVDVN